MSLSDWRRRHCGVGSGKGDLRLAFVNFMFINYHFATCFEFVISMRYISCKKAVHKHCTTSCEDLTQCLHLYKASEQAQGVVDVDYVSKKITGLYGTPR